MGKFVDLTGQKHGRLTALKYIKTSDTMGAMWLCKCECGNEKVISAHSLRRRDQGRTESCGCVNKESARQRMENRPLYKDTAIDVINPNRRIRKDNKSGHVGVIKHKERWRAYITCQKKRIELGLYDKLEDATKARKQAEEELFHPIIEEYKNEVME